MGELLGNLELIVLMVAMRLGDDAYGVPIMREVRQSTRRSLAHSSIYAALERLEEKGLITLKLGEPTPERGGRAKRYVRVTAKGVRAVRETHRTLLELSEGLPGLRVGHA